MGLTFESLGKFIHEVDVRNTDLSVTKLMGVNLSKQMMPSVANIVGTDLSAYKVVNKGQFACKLMSVGRDACLPIALKRDDEPVIISSAYYSFEVNDENEIMSEYLMMCFLRPDFDRELWFRTGGDVRGGVTWDTFCEMPIPYVPISVQRNIVHDYQIIMDRIELLQKVSNTIESIISAVFKHYITDNEAYDTYSTFEFGQYPSSWELKPMIDVVDVRDGTHDSPTPVSDGHKLVTSVHLNPYSVNKEGAYSISDNDYFEINKRSVVDTRDILMSMIGTVGRLSLVTDDPVDYAIKNMALFKTSKLPYGVHFYLLSYLKSSIVTSYISSYLAGSTQSYISLETLRSMPVIVPLEFDLKQFIKNVEPMYESLISCEREITRLGELGAKICP